MLFRIRHEILLLITAFTCIVFFMSYNALKSLFHSSDHSHQSKGISTNLSNEAEINYPKYRSLQNGITNSIESINSISKSSLQIAKSDIYDHYFDEAGQYYNIPPLLLKKIATIESGINPNAINNNANGTKDYGLMQINSSHLHRLSQWGINETNILDPKINIYAGSWLLSEHIKEHGFNLQAIGRYHSATPSYKQIWLNKLTTAFK